MAAEQFLTWSRPAGVPSPTVWGHHEHGGVKYRIQDATPDLHQRILAYYAEEYFHDEPASRSVGLVNDEVSMAEFTFFISTALSQGASLVALEEGAGAEPEIVGAMIIPVLSKEDPELPEVNGRGARLLFGLSDALRGASPYGDPLTRPEAVQGDAWRGPVPFYACDLGLWTRRDRRRRGLALAVLKAVPRVCRGLGVPHHSTLFTSATSQALAVRAGFKEISRLKYADVVDAEGRPAFPDITEVDCVMLGVDID